MNTARIKRAARPDLTLTGHFARMTSRTADLARLGHPSGVCIWSHSSAHASVFPLSKVDPLLRRCVGSSKD
jgi:hypothetical protein